MRFHDPLDDILGNPVRLRVLRILARAREDGLTGRELARRCGASPSQTALALHALEETGLLIRRVVGPAHIWRLSRSHAMARRVRDLFEHEAGALNDLRVELKVILEPLPIDRAVLFGSIAKGVERAASDIDLFVQVRSTKEKERVERTLGNASPGLARRFGNPLSSLVLTREQLRRPSSPQLVDDISEAGIPVAG